MIGSTFLYQKKRQPFAAKLNLISLMDIFTILVFFLLLSSGESENIENARFVELPKSTTGTSPHKELIVSIDENDIWLEGEVVGSVAEVLQDPDKPIPLLAVALNGIAEKKQDLSAFEKSNGFSVTIMGDKDVSYTLLKSVMTTCRLHNYRNISLAVNQVGPIARPQPSALAIKAKSNIVGG